MKHQGNDLPDNTISTFTNDILNIILLADIERDLARSRRGIGRARRHSESELVDRCVARVCSGTQRCMRGRRTTHEVAVEDGNELQQQKRQKCRVLEERKTESREVRFLCSSRLANSRVNAEFRQNPTASWYIKSQAWPLYLLLSLADRFQEVYTGIFVPMLRFILLRESLSTMINLALGPASNSGCRSFDICFGEEK